MTDKNDGTRGVEGDGAEIVPLTIQEKYRDEITRWGLYKLPDYDGYSIQVVRYTTMDGKVLTQSEQIKQEYLNDQGTWVEFQPMDKIPYTMVIPHRLLMVLAIHSDLIDLELEINKSLEQLAVKILDGATLLKSQTHETEMQEKGLIPDASDL